MSFHYSEEENLWTVVIDWDAIREVEPIIPKPAIQAISLLIEPKWANGGYIPAVEMNTM